MSSPVRTKIKQKMYHRKWVDLLYLFCKKCRLFLKSISCKPSEKNYVDLNILHQKMFKQEIIFEKSLVIFKIERKTLNTWNVCITCTQIVQSFRHFPKVNVIALFKLED